MDTKLALDEIKLNMQRFSQRIVYLIPFLAFISTILMVIFTLFSFGVFDFDIYIIYLIPDIYTLIAILGVQLITYNIVSILLTIFITVFSLSYFVLQVLVVYKFYEINRNFLSLSRVDVALKIAKNTHLYLNLYILFQAIAFVIPSFGWIISSVLANVFLALAFLSFHAILKKYGLRLQITKDTSFFISLSALFNIIAFGFVFIDISFLLVSLIGYVFLFLGVRQFGKQVQYIAPIVREAPPPPTIEAPVGPAPRPIIGTPKTDVAKTDDIPSITENENY